MIVKYGRYSLHAPDAGSGFNLMVDVVREKKDTGEKYQDIKIVGYNMSLGHAVRQIAELSAKEDKFESLYDLLASIEASIIDIDKELKNKLK